MKLQSTFDVEFQILESLMGEYLQAEYNLYQAYENEEYERVDDLHEAELQKEMNLIAKYINIGLMTNKATSEERAMVEELHEKAKNSPMVRAKIMKGIKQDRRYRKLEQKFDW